MAFVKRDSGTRKNSSDCWRWFLAKLSVAAAAAAAALAFGSRQRFTCLRTHHFASDRRTRPLAIVGTFFAQTHGKSPPRPPKVSKPPRPHSMANGLRKQTFSPPLPPAWLDCPMAAPTARARSLQEIPVHRKPGRVYALASPRLVQKTGALLGRTRRPFWPTNIAQLKAQHPAYKRHCFTRPLFHLRPTLESWQLCARSAHAHCRTSVARRFALVHSPTH